MRLADAALAAGMHVTAIETDAARRAAIRKDGHGAQGTLDVVGSSDDGLYSVTLICVPTRGEDGAFDSRALLAALDEVGPHLSPRELVAIESTVPPGTTQELLRPALERASGRRVGDDVFLAHVPERFFATIPEPYRTIRRIVGGVTGACTASGVAFYRELVDEVFPVSSAVVAECAKVFENAFRFANVALVNEFSIAALRLGIDPREVIAAAATKHRGFMPFWPSTGVGGHCVPASTRLLADTIERSGISPLLFSALLAADERLPEQIALALDLSPGMRVLLLGAGYKSGSARTTESPSLRLAKHLCTIGVEVDICDSHLPKGALGDKTSVHRPDEVQNYYDVAVVAAWEPEFEAVIARLKNSRVVDLRGSGNSFR